MALPRSSLSPTSYRVADVWRPGRGNMVIRYRCVEILPKGGYRVVARDAFPCPVKPADLAAADAAFANVLAKWASASPAKGFPNVLEAIQEFDG